MGRVCYLIAVSDADIDSLRNREDDVDEYMYRRYCIDASAEEMRDFDHIDKAWKIVFDLLEILPQQAPAFKKAYQANLFHNTE